MMKKLSVPTIFFDDHLSRDLAFIAKDETDPATPRAIWVLRSGKKTTEIVCRVETLRELYFDAFFYSDFECESDDSFMKSIVGSARSTVRAIERKIPAEYLR
jgi:hypothetical protein